MPGTGLYAYPDVTVACGPRTYDGKEPPSLRNPSLLVELTSDSTEDYDRGTKFLHYQAIASLQEYVIVSHRERRVNRFRRLDNGQWLSTTLLGDGAVECRSSVAPWTHADRYAGVVFNEGRTL